MITYHNDVQQGTEEWHSLRRGIITASNMSLLMTSCGKIANNKSSRSYLYRLAAERIMGVTEPGVYTQAMANGHMLEPFARQIYNNKISKVKECGFVTRKVQGGVVGYSPDGLVGRHGAIEIKSRMSKYTIDTILSKDVPAEYWLQCQAGLFVTGRKWVDFLTYTPGLPLVPIRIERIETIMIAIERAVVAAEETIQQTVDNIKTLGKKWPQTEPIDIHVPTEEITFD